MESKFIKELLPLSINGNFGYKEINELLNKSEVYKSLDMANYYINDEDKLRMAITNWSNFIDNDPFELISASKHYFESALGNAKKLVEALQKEIHDADLMLVQYGPEYLAKEVNNV